MRYRNKLFIIIILFIIKVNGDEAGQTLLHTFQNTFQGVTFIAILTLTKIRAHKRYGKDRRHRLI